MHTLSLVKPKVVDIATSTAQHTKSKQRGLAALHQKAALKTLRQVLWRFIPARGNEVAPWEREGIGPKIEIAADPFCTTYLTASAKVVQSALIVTLRRAELMPLTGRTSIY